jgi:hypothetical protein
MIMGEHHDGSAATVDAEAIHQKIYRRVYDAVKHILGEQHLTGTIWLATQQAAEDIAAGITAPAQSVAHPARETIYAAAKEGNLQYWRDSARQRAAFDAWVAGGCEGDCPQECGGSIVDYITNAVHAAIATQPPAAPVDTSARSDGKTIGEFYGDPGARSSAGTAEVLIERLVQAAVEYENNCDRLVAKTIRIELEKAKQAIRDAIGATPQQSAEKEPA